MENKELELLINRIGHLITTKSNKNTFEILKYELRELYSEAIKTAQEQNVTSKKEDCEQNVIDDFWTK